MSPEQRRELRAQRMDAAAESAFYAEVRELASSRGISESEAETTLRAQREASQREAREMADRGITSIGPPPAPPERGWFRSLMDKVGL